MVNFFAQFKKDIDKLHKETEEKTFIDRYRDELREEGAKKFKDSGALTLMDHYRHLCQLLPVYETLEKKIRDMHFAPSVPDSLKYLLNQSAKIKKDMDFLESRIQVKDKHWVTLSTYRYIQLLDKIMIREGEKANEVFAHFLVRILGDLLGGSKLKEYVSHLYERSNIPAEIREEGLNFYTFEKDTLKNMFAWLSRLSNQNNANQDDVITDKDYAQIVTAANESFRMHISIFDELEQTRAAAGPGNNLPAASMASNINSFFNSNNWGRLAAGAALATGAFLLVNSINRMGN